MNRNSAAVLDLLGAAASPSQCGRLALISSTLHDCEAARRWRWRAIGVGLPAQPHWQLVARNLPHASAKETSK